jgi:hypothetical protein
MVVLRWDEVAAAIAALPFSAFAAAVALHVASLVLRSEAWRLCLAAITGTPLPRVALHGANASAFVAGIVQSHAALPVRVALLARLGRGTIRPAQVALADVPIVALEIGCTCLLVAVAALVAGSWWTVPVAIALACAVPVAGRVVHARFAHRPLAGGLAVLGHARLRVALLGLLVLVELAGLARLGVLMDAAGLPVSLVDVALVSVSVGVFGLLPLGPSASPAGTVAALGAASLSSALVLGVALSATSICGVVVYACVVGALGVGARERRAVPAAEVGAA